MSFELHSREMASAHCFRVKKNWFCFAIFTTEISFARPMYSCLEDWCCIIWSLSFHCLAIYQNITVIQCNHLAYLWVWYFGIMYLILSHQRWTEYICIYKCKKRFKRGQKTEKKRLNRTTDRPTDGHTLL